MFILKERKKRGGGEEHEGEEEGEGGEGEEVERRWRGKQESRTRRWVGESCRRAGLTIPVVTADQWRAAGGQS